MEDVLPNPHAPRRNSAPAEPPSWTGSSAAETSDPPTETISYSLTLLFSAIESCRDYPAACREVARILRELPEGLAPAAFLRSVLRARFSRVWMERFLFALLSVRHSDWQTAGYVLRFEHLRRLLSRVERRAPLSPGETALIREMITALALSSPGDFEPFRAAAARAFQALRRGEPVVSGDLGLLIYLLRSECAAMGERIRRLEQGLPPGDLPAAARLTTLLDLLEERMNLARELAQRLGAFGPVHDAPMGLEEAMGPGFGELLMALDMPDLEGLKEALELQRAKRVPTRDLIALSSLCRWVAEARGLAAGPLEWVRMALRAYEGGRFRVDAAGALPAVQALIAEAEVECEKNWVSGDFGDSPCSSWMARDGLTRPFRSADPNRLPPDPRRLALANVHRDAVILKLLDHGKVRETDGLVAAIVEASRSPAVHSKIASSRQLHSGPACARVPVALLKSPVSIPQALARALVHPALLPFSEMKILYRHRAGLRPEVAEALHAFLSQAYAL